MRSPGEYRWVITSPRLNEIQLDVLSFPELWGGRHDSEGARVFSVRCLPETFANAAYAAATQLLAEHGEEGYLERWAEHPFPTTQLAELGRVLQDYRLG
jgi:hypothetical protein